MPIKEGEHSKSVFTIPAALKVMSELGGSDEVTIERNPFACKCGHIQPRSIGRGEKKNLSCVVC